MKYILAFVLGIGCTWLSYRYYNNLLDTKEMECRVQIKVLSDYLMAFKKSCGRLPSEDEGLKVLEAPSSVNCNAEPLLHKVPLDPWDNEFTYLLRGEKVYLLGSKQECGYQVAQ